MSAPPTVHRDDCRRRQLSGSGTHAMSVSGTLAQINADLATLT